MQSVTEIAKEDWDYDASHLVLVGEPPFLEGELKVVSHRDDTLKIKRLAVHGLNLIGAKDQPAAWLEVRALIQAREQRLLPVTLQVHPQTPPGTHSAEVEIGAERIPIKVEVLASPAFEVTPDEVTFKLELGEIAKSRHIVSNVGNVPFQVPETVGITLDERDVVLHALLASARQSGDRGYQPVFNDMTTKLHDVENNSPCAVVKSPATTIAPGASVEVELIYQFPATLEIDRKYHGTLTLADEEIAIELSLLSSSPLQPSEQ